MYLIRPGESFKDSDGSVKTGGMSIELDDEMAKLHAARLQPMLSQAAEPTEPENGQAAYASE